MYAGEIVERGTAKQMIFDPVHPYTKKLMGSIIVPEEGMKGHKLAAIPGAPPNLKNVPEGRRFADRLLLCKGRVPERESGDPDGGRPVLPLLVRPSNLKGVVRE
ncbi:hypothetical protein LJK88_32635 [Paenibacillus sp. P26]|nr:hypothetical protein LJK88_32635 [Paenibacillus sp. P26]